MKIITPNTYEGERALYGIKEAVINHCVFDNGESPLKECQNLDISETDFQYKYPLWYGKDIVVKDSRFHPLARSGVWYTKNITIKDTVIDAPKTFRRCEGVYLENVELSDASETMWKCKDVRLKHVHIVGDYFGFNSEDIVAEDIIIDGNYCFDGAKNVVINRSTLNSKDSFWNVENAVITNSYIEGEYLAWNSKNLTFINCKIKSHQGFCYIKRLIIKNSEILDSDLIFELCEDIDIEVKKPLDSVKNPISGKINAPGIKELILDKEVIDPSKTEIIIDE